MDKKDFARSRPKAGLSFTVCGGEQGHPPTSLHFPALPSYKLQVPGRPLICLAVQKPQSAGFPFLFAYLELKWGSVSRHEGEEGEGAACKGSLCKRDPVEGKSSGGFRWAGHTGTWGVWGCQDPCFLIAEVFWRAWISLANRWRRNLLPSFVLFVKQDLHSLDHILRIFLHCFWQHFSLPVQDSYPMLDEVLSVLRKCY